MKAQEVTVEAMTDRHSQDGKTPMKRLATHLNPVASRAVNLSGWGLVGMFSLLVPAGNLLAADDNPLPPSAPISETGSLWSDSGYQQFLYYDQKAKAVGDLVTVKVVESSSASRTASTSLSRDSSIEAGVSALAGLETQAATLRPELKPSALLGASTSNNFEGDGSTTRSGSLTAVITAKVIQVLPNRNLVIVGQQEVKINNELQILTVRGVVRPQDIAINNVVLSTYIADAKIEYAGTGVVTDKQKPGWLARTVDKVWPF